MEYSNTNTSKVKRHVRILEPNLSEIGRRIRLLRGEELQMSFAVELGITQGQLSKFERGKAVPPVSVLLRLSQLSGKTVDWILKG